MKKNIFFILIFVSILSFGFSVNHANAQEDWLCSYFGIGCPVVQQQPACVSNYGSSCTGGSNACGGSTHGTVDCGGSCVNLTLVGPSVPDGYGNSCVSAPNSCGQTSSGSIGCSGGCSAVTPAESSCPRTTPVTGNTASQVQTPGDQAPRPQIPVANIPRSTYGDPCESEENMCGLKNSGRITYWGTCSQNDMFPISKPPDTLCVTTVPPGTVFNLNTHGGENRVPNDLDNQIASRTQDYVNGRITLTQLISWGQTFVQEASNNTQNFVIRYDSVTGVLSTGCTNTTVAIVTLGSGGGGGIDCNVVTCWPRYCSPTITENCAVPPGGTPWLPGGIPGTITIPTELLESINGVQIQNGTTQQGGVNGGQTFQAPPPAPSIGEFKATPKSVIPGRSTILSWSSSNSTSCSGTGFNTGGLVSNSVSVSPRETTTYTLTCSGAGGQVSSKVKVNVINQVFEEF